jgi:hypothetical protein
MAVIMVPLAAGGLAAAQEPAGPVAVPAPVAAVAPEVHAPPQVGWWDRMRYRLHACFLGFPEEFEATPLGASVYAFGRAQVANAEAAQMVLYRADFIEGSGTLNPRGRDQLARIALLLPRNFCPVIIEPTLCAPELDQARLLEVVNELSRCAFAVPPQRVVIGLPPAAGLSGVEAGMIYNNLLNQTLSGGARSGGWAGAGGAGGGQGYGSSGRPGGPGQ